MQANLPDRLRLERLIAAHHPCVRIVTSEEDFALELVRQVAFDRKDCVLTGWSGTTGVHDGLLGSRLPGADDTLNAAVALKRLNDNHHWNLAYLLDMADYLRDEQTRRAWRDLVRDCPRYQRTIIMIDHESEAPAIVRAHSTRMELSLPDGEEIEQIIRGTLGRLNRERQIHIEITRGQLDTVIKNLRGLTRRQAQRVIVDCVAIDRHFDAEDINHILALKRRELQGGGLLEYIETPADLDGIGGMQRLKEWLKLRQFGDHDEAERFGVQPPRGVMMLGVQGAGKSLCAKAIATAWQRPLLRMDPSALYDRFIGESERRLRDALRQAEAMAPIVLWIDEIEKGFASASSHNTDGGLSRRMFGTLLTWMQEHTAPVFLVATANDIEALPPELLRKGRFDEIFFVDLPEADARRQILRIHLGKRGRDPAKFDLDALVAASDGFSGAEIEQAIIAALYRAYGERAELTDEHVIAGLRQSPPLSVTMAEKVAALRRWSQGRCVPAD